MSVVTAQAFNRSPSAVKEMAKKDPVFVTERGRTSIVVMAADLFNRLTSRGASNVYESLHMEPETVDDFEPVVSRDLAQIADL